MRPLKPLSGALGNTAKGEFQAWLSHRGELGLGREQLWASRKTPILAGVGKEKGRPQWVPSVFQNVLKDEGQRVLGRHKIWTCWM